MLSFKAYLTEAAKVKAEDYEAAIVMGWYSIHNKSLPSDNAGITDKVLEKIKKNTSVLNAGNAIASNVLKLYPALSGKEAEQYGRKKGELTDFWKGKDKKFPHDGATDVTPKTDVLIGGMRFSVKIGIAQLMSGGKDETTATYYAALKNSDKQLQKDPQFTKVAGILESFVKSTLAPSKLRPIIKSKTDPVVNAAEDAHKDCMTEMGTLFENNKSFQLEFAREAMSGYEKYGKNNDAAAEWMLVSTHDGSKVQVHSVDDDSYCQKIVDKMKLQARFKTSQRTLASKKSKTNPYGKTGEYNFWSVVSLIVDAFDEAYAPYEGQVLTEGILNTIKSKVSGFFSRVWNKVKKFYQKGIQKMQKFLGLSPDITDSKNIQF